MQEMAAVVRPVKFRFVYPGLKPRAIDFAYPYRGIKFYHFFLLAPHFCLRQVKRGAREPFLRCITPKKPYFAMQKLGLFSSEGAQYNSPG